MARRVAVVAAWILITVWGFTLSQAEESTTTTTTSPDPNNNNEKADDDFDVTNENWGTYYDPKNIFCGNYDCYKILGFDYESWGKVKPTTKQITKRFRKLSRYWHPDKSKHRDAKNRFVKIARAYETLTNVDQRSLYDSFRYDQEAYVRKYGSSVLWQSAPKTDAVLVIVVLTLIAHIAAWQMQKERWNRVANRFIRAAVEDWNMKEGGSPESKQLRANALEILAERNSSSTTTLKSNTKSKKVSAKEKKKQEQEAIKPIVTELVHEMHDFGGGVHLPTWKDLLIVSIAQWPVSLAQGTVWQMGYWLRRLQKLDLNDNERQVLTMRAVGPVIWNTSDEDLQKEMVDAELWIQANLVEWKTEQEVKKLSASEQKKYWSMKKKGKVE